MHSRPLTTKTAAEVTPDFRVSHLDVGAHALFAIAQAARCCRMLLERESVEIELPTWLNDAQVKTTAQSHALIPTPDARGSALGGKLPGERMAFARQAEFKSWCCG